MNIVYCLSAKLIIIHNNTVIFKLAILPKRIMATGLPEITFDIAENGDTLTFACSGPLTIDTIEVLGKKLEEARRQYRDREKT